LFIIEDEKLLHGTEPDRASLLSESGPLSLHKKGVHFDSHTKLSDAGENAYIRKAGGALAHPRFETDINAFRRHIAQNPPRPGQYALSPPRAGIKSRFPAPASENGNSVPSTTTEAEAETSMQADMTMMFNKATFSKLARINRQRDMYAGTRGESKKTKNKDGDKKAYRASDAVASPLRWSQD
jgi:hypothetical protein